MGCCRSDAAPASFLPSWRSTRRFVNRLWRISFVALLLGAAPVPYLAGDGDRTGTIGGVVRYGSGEAAQDVVITITEEESGKAVVLRSDAAGTFAATGLAAGTYSLRIDDGALAPFVRTGISLGVGQVYLQDGVLLPAGSGDPSLPGVPALPDSCTEPGEFVGRCVEAGPVSPRRARGRQRPDNPSRPFAPPLPPAPASGPTARRTEHVQEFRAGTALRSGDGARAGAFLPHTGKDGTNEFHGAAYHFLGNDAANARGFFGEKGKFRESNFGAYIGGPIARNRTYFTYHYDRRSERSGPRSGFGNTTPVAAFRNGDFGGLSTGRPLASDALGRPVSGGQIFDPASTGSAGGVPVRDPFPNNVVPASHPLRSRVSAGVLRMMVEPQRSGLEFNVQGNPFGEQIWALDAPSHFARVDHAFDSGFRGGLSVSRTSHPALRNCGGVGGCSVPHSPVEAPERNGGYYGTGVYEDITTHHVRQKLDWIAGPRLLNQTAVGYEEFHVIGHSLSAGAGWQERLWGPAGNGLLAQDAGPPALQFTGNTRYSPLGNEWGRSGFLANHLYRVSNGLTWMRGAHSVKVGGEFRHHCYPFRGWTNNVAGRFNFHRRHTGGFDAYGNNLPATGDPFASFLLGQVNSTHFQIPDFPTISESFVSWRVVDEFDVSSNLTVTIGLRFDYQSAIRERDDNMSTFDPNVPNPGAAGRLGAMIFAGRGPGRTGERTLEDPPRDAFGPRVGFAYRVGPRNVARGGYGITYSTVPHAHFNRVNTLGFRSHATAVDLSNGQRPAYFLDDGFPRDSIVLPPAIDPAVGNSTSPAAVTRDRATLPRVQHWSLTLQRQAGRATSVDIRYAGIRGSRLIADRRVLGPAANANAPSVLAHGADVLAGRAGSDTARGAAIPMPYRGFDGSVAQSLRPFPHMLNIGYMHVPAGNSFFHELSAKVERRFSDGAHFEASYAWSKLTGMGAGRIQPLDGLGQGPQNPTDTHSLERGLSADDVPHRVLAAFAHAVPFPRSGRSGLVSKVLGGWSVAGILRVESGTPVNIVMANDLEPFLFNGQKRPDVLSSRVRVARRGSFDAATQALFDRAAFADPGPLRFGDASRTMDFVRGFSSVSEDFSLYKDTWINQKFKVRFQTQLANAFNRVVFCDPNRNWSASSFGRVFAQCNSPRSVRFGLRMDF